MIRLEMKNYDMILIEKQLKYQLYHQVTLINMNILLVKTSNQQQLIEQARFTYSPVGKAFEKQIKTIEDEGEKQVDALKKLKPKKQTKAITYKSDDDNNTRISKEIYNEILEEKIVEILKMSREINCSNLVYNFKGPTTSIILLYLEVQCILIIN